MSKLFLSLCCLLCALPLAGQERGGDSPFHGKSIAYWIEQLKDPSQLAREEALVVLGQAGPAAREALPTVIDLCRGPETSIRIQAALALHRIDPSNGASLPILRGVDRTNRSWRVTILSALAPSAADSPDVLEHLLLSSLDADEHVRARAEEEIKGLGPRIRDQLAKMLGHRRTEVRRQAAVYLGRLGAGGQPVLPQVKALLKDDDWPTRFQAALALWRIGRVTDGLPLLLEAAAKEEDSSVRGEALEALVRMRPVPEEAIPSMRAALRRVPLELDIQFAEILWERDKQAGEILPTVHMAVKRWNLRPQSRRLQAYHLAAKLGAEAKPLQETLLELLKTDSSEPLRGMTAQVLGRLGPDSMPALVEIIKSERRTFFQGWALGHMGKEAVPTVVELLGHSDEPVRNIAFAALDILGPDGQEAVPTLVEMLRQAKDPKTQRRLIACLAHIGPSAREAVPQLIEAAREPDPLTATGAMLALVHVKADRERLLPVVRAAFRHADPKVRATALEILAHVAPADAEIPGLVAEMLSHYATIPSAVQAAGGLGADGKPGPHRKTVLPILTAALKTPYRHRLSLLQSLEKAGPLLDDLLPVVKENLGNYNMTECLAAARILVRRGAADRETAKAIVKAVENASDTYKSFSLPLFQELGPDAAVAIPLVRTLLDTKNEYTRIQAAATLLAIDRDQAPLAKPLLLEALKKPRTHFAALALVALWKHDPKDDALRILIAQELEALPESKAIVDPLLHHGGPWARAIFPTLIDALKDADVSLRSHVAMALWKIEPNNEWTIAALIEVLDGYRYYESELKLAIQHLGELGPAAKEAVPVLRRAARATVYSGNRTDAFEALRRIDPEHRLPWPLP